MSDVLKRDQWGNLINWSGPFLYMLSGWRGRYEDLYPTPPASRYKPAAAFVLPSEEHLRRRRWGRPRKIADEVAQEFNELMGKP